MTGFGFKNQSPGNVLAGDQPVKIAFAFPQSVAPGVSVDSPVIDVNEFISFYSWWGWDAAVGGYLRIELRWLDADGNMIDNDQFIINGQGAGSPTISGGAFIRGPIRSNSVVVRVKNEGAIAANNNFTMFGSLRNISSVRLIEYGGTANVLLSTRTFPGGLSATTLYLPVFSGQVAATIIAAGTAGQVIRLQMIDYTGSGFIYDRSYTIGTTAADFGLSFIFPRVPVHCVITNTGASAANEIRTTWFANEP